LERSSRRRRLIQLRISDRQLRVRDDQTRIEPQSLIERARGLNPNVTVQVRKALVVVRLRVFRRGGGRVVSTTDVGAQRQRSIEELGGNDGKRVSVSDRLSSERGVTGMTRCDGQQHKADSPTPRGNPNPYTRGRKSSVHPKSRNHLKSRTKDCYLHDPD